MKIVLSFIIFLIINFNSFARIDSTLIDPDKIVPATLLKTALSFYDNNLDKIKNTDFLTIINFKEHNSKERLYLIDLRTGFVERFLVAHGKNSDKNFDGFADSFSNKIDSLQSSLGFYLTGETYDGSNGYSLRLDGLSSTNSNARVRSIVIHGADYVTPGAKIGRSYGCPAVEERIHQYLIDKIKNGSLIFASLE
jgi:hypothetical protein